MMELIIPGSLGPVYGLLRMPCLKECAPLIILSHGFGGTHEGIDDYALYFCEKGFATYSFDFSAGAALEAAAVGP